MVIMLFLVFRSFKTNFLIYFPELEKEDNLSDLKDASNSVTRDALATYIKELETLKRLAKLNKVYNIKKTLKDQEAVPEASKN